MMRHSGTWTAGRARGAMLGALLTSLALTSALPAAAEQAPMEEARQRFVRGVELYEAGDYSGALAEFTRTYELRPHWALLLNIAQCYGNIGRYGEAVRHLERYLEEGGNEVPSGRREEVEAEIERLRSFLAHLTIRVNVDGATVTIDDQEVGSSPLDESIQVRSGLHVIEARRSGYRPARRELVVAGGTTPPPVELELEPVDDDSPGRRAPGQPSGAAELQVEVNVDGAEVELDGERVGASPVEPVSRAAGAATLRVEREGYLAYETQVPLRAGQTTVARVELTRGGAGVGPGWFWATLGLTVAAGAGAVVTGALALRREGELHQFLDDVEAGQISGTAARLELQRQETVDEARALALATDVLLITASAAAITTLVLAFFTRFSAPESSAEVQVSGAIAPDGAALLTARGRF